VVKLINKFTGSPMWVAESRLEEYLAVGHQKPSAKAAPKAEKPIEAEPVKAEAEPAKPAVKKTAKKTTKAKR